MIRHYSFRALILAALMGASTAAYAQVPTAQTGSASPGRVQEQTPRPDFSDRAVMPAVEVDRPQAQAAPAGSENIQFTLNNLRLDGVTAYKESELRGVYAESVGQTISLADLYGIAAALTNKYRNDGYILTQVIVPPQTIEGGNVRLQVVEGYLYSVNVALEEGAPAETEAAMNLIRGYASRIPAGYALNIADLERYLLFINDLPGVSARGVLAPNAANVGAADLNILVQRDPFEAVVGIDNYGTKYLGAIQFSGAAALNSMLGNNERLTAQAVLAPDPGQPMELAYFAAGYSQPIGTRGLRLDFDASYTATEPGYTLDEFDVKGNARFLGIELNYPVIRSRNTNLYTMFSFDMRDVDTRNNIEDTRTDNIRALRTGMRLEKLDRVFGAGLNVLDLELAHGLDVLGASSKNDPNKSRPDGDPRFTKLNLEVQRLQRLANQWNLLLAARGQLSNGPLLSSEEFGVGGMGYGRGYDPSEIIGDEGIAGKVEVQWNLPGEFGITNSHQLYGFYDAGRVWNDDPTNAKDKANTATSAGVGVRAKIGSSTNIDMTVAVPLDRSVQTMKDQDPRFFMSVSKNF
ncbi:ShlB/FhaC/HecB family hemolysin secretion/activation protein [Micavibrio aeruginosavorus]|uniref:Surface antigen family protein n=1 Tax=Micavibrio aeruginosavorus (strain ARL-13) TaxID=856793 RepID=G2KPW1_MICAA|nr:ShlB/FhaC/HecB family hemolysin secretion/activation protein [Micavibrio aeruginosavorus]AEP10329.1 surface antigen family protein [Micavibrio aeruginosavorus ARL-13]